MANRTKNLFAYSMSLAASWAWGVSLIVGMQTVQSKGTLPFVIWAVANSLALPLFGIIAFRIKKLHKVIDTKIVQIFTTLVMVFCLWIQMNSIREKLLELSVVSNLASIIITIAVSIILAVALFRDGLIKNILLDKWLWAVCYIILLLMIIYGAISQVKTYDFVISYSNDDITWAWNATLILFAGPIMNIQNWQMAHKLKKEKVLEISHFLAGGIFAVYMLLVFLLAHFQFDSVMTTIQIFAILCITLTTMDASIVGMQRIGGEKVGLVIALTSIALWQFVIPMGVLDLWTFMGNRRKEVAAICILIALYLQFRENRKIELGGDKI